MGDDSRERDGRYLPSPVPSARPGRSHHPHHSHDWPHPHDSNDRLARRLDAMPLTPEDVANKQFTSTRLKPGYDETEVDEFLDEVEAELTRLYRENDELKSKLVAAQRAAAESGDGGRATTTQQIAPPPAPTPAPPPPAPPAPTPTPTPAQPPAQAAPTPAAAAAPSSESATGILAMAQRTADEFIAEAQTQ